MNGIHAGRAVNLHADRLAEFEALDEAMGRFGGVYKAKGESDTKIQRRFFATFGIDVLSAGALKRVDAEKLRGKIDDVLNRA
ncbi:hypothetical protein D9M71_556920 [compost metagenome]